MTLELDAPTPVRAASAKTDWLRALELTAKLNDAPTRTFPVVLDELGARFGDVPALLSDHESLSFEGLAHRARAYAAWAEAQGLRQGHVVALLMPNRPDYVAAWAGLSRLGVVVALLNTNLGGAGLAHCLRAAAARVVVVDARLVDRLGEASPHLDDAPRVFVRAAPGEDRVRTDGPHRVLDLDGAGTAPLDVPSTSVVLSDTALLIYTSGTTGLPKAARVSHRRIMTWSFWFAGLTDAGPDDRMYDCLPLYHSVGGVVAVGSMLVRGGGVVIAEKFSAGRFWAEIRAWDCTVVQYIGELCRYLLAAPPAPGDRAHGLRLICGNGLKGDIWTTFQERFGIPRVLEFYAATEGSFSLVNVEGEPGAIGRIPPFLQHRFPAAVVRFDGDRGEPMRGPDGFCIRCGRDEPGEAIGRLTSKDGGGSFEGYTSAAESDRKVLRDVFEPGDRWFRTGDLMRIDPRGFWYFVDRVGDTFRWKGENVSTAEVAAALSSCPGVLDATVYGVEVPGRDGRAGMASLVTGGDFSAQGMRERLATALPAYARPLFLRLQREIPVTETFKHRKADLLRDGFDPGRTDDPILFDDARVGAYVPLDAALFDEIAAGRVRL